jgi:uncharacterized damage-inducible protein DinB
MSMEEEKSLLHRHLAAQRRHVLGILEGLDEEQLRRPVLPSGWSCLGVLRHLTLSDEHWWFRCVMGGEPQDYFPTEPGGDWVVAPDEPALEVVAAYRAECELADAVIAAMALDDPPRSPDPVWAEWGMSFPDLRSVLLHVITETAVHAGHLDAVRELIDGRQWIVLDG